MSLRSSYLRCFIIIIIIIIFAVSFASRSASNEADKMALLAMRDEFIKGGSILTDSSNSLNTWNDSRHFCQWEGIKCGKRHKRVTVVDLAQQKLEGILSHSIGNLTFLKELYLTNNSLHGEIPKQIGKLWRLQMLDLSGNSFQGRIPSEIERFCFRLRERESFDKSNGERRRSEMENINAIAVETGGVVVVVDNGGGCTDAVNETTTVAGGNDKNETIKNEKSRVNKKARKLMMKKMISEPKVVSGETSAAGDEMAAAAVTSEGGVKACRILVSNTKKPLLFYLNLAKRYIKQNNYAELSGLGMAIPTVVTIAEILKKDGWATEKDITISSVPLKDDANGRVLMKAKIGILLEKNELEVAKGPSDKCENESAGREFSCETNGKVFVDITQHLSVTSNGSENASSKQQAAD